MSRKLMIGWSEKDITPQKESSLRGSFMKEYRNMSNAYIRNRNGGGIGK